MLKILSQPFPKENDLRKGFRAAAIGGVIVFIFLWSFKPFGITNAPVPDLTLFILGYGLVSFFCIVVFILFQYFFPFIFDEQRWTVGKNIIYFVLMVICIGLGNLYYTHITTGFLISASSFISFQLYTFSVSIVVAAVFTLLKYFRSLQVNVSQARILDADVQAMPSDDPEQPILIRSENEKENLKLTSRTLLFIESADNYSKVYYIANDRMVSVMIRTTLKKLEGELKVPFIFRCHRSFIVNLHNIESISGNSQGYRLHIKNYEQTLPVARRTGGELHERLKNLGASFLDK